MPSLALLDEPVEIATLQSDWDLLPSFNLTDESFIASLPVPVGSDLYGTGEVTGALRRNGYDITLWNTDNYGYGKDEGRRLYQSHPWVLGLRPDGTAFGVLFDSTWRSTLRTASDEITFTSEGPPCRVIIIDRESPQAVMQALAGLTGTMPLPPLWSLGYHQCKYSYFPDSRVREIADEFRSREIPCDVIWMDIDYMDGFRVFSFDPNYFPHPEETNRYLHEKGFKSIWMINPGVKVDKRFPVYNSGTKSDVWVEQSQGVPFVGEVWPGDCVFPDFTMPTARAWWAGLYAPFMATGIDGVWNDMNEPAVFNGPDSTMPTVLRHRGGGELPSGSHLRYHNVYGMLMVKSSREGILQASPDRRPFILSRSNHLGGHRYAATWTGDNRATWEHLKMSIPMSLNLGLSGQPFNGADIGGFIETPSRDLYGHWIALGVFYPFSRSHSDNSSRGNEPWNYGAIIEEVGRVAISRRYRLMPYIYTQMEYASRSGMPLMQPLFFADPENSRLRSEEAAFLFGPDLIVIPRWATNPVLPDGNWRTLDLLKAGKEDDGYQPELRLRPGAIIPLGRVAQNTSEPLLDPLTCVVSLDESGFAEGVLYEDSGDGFGYLEDDFARTWYHAQRTGDTVRLELAEREGNRLISEREAHVQILSDEGVYAARGNLADGLVVCLDEPVPLASGDQAHHPATGRIFGITEADSNWVWSVPFGLLWIADYPWVWSQNSGTWLYVWMPMPASSEIIWMWFPGLNDTLPVGWFYSAEGWYGRCVNAVDPSVSGNLRDGLFVDG
jgi:alpha-glucosidase